MGTRSITVFREVDEDNDVCAIYRQFDGYPKGMGNDLKEILKKHELVNGFSLGKHKKVQHNGVGCLAAYVIGLLKWDEWLGPRPQDPASKPRPANDGKVNPPIGNVYMTPVHKCMKDDTFQNADGSGYAGAEWAYVVYSKGQEIWLKVIRVGWGKRDSRCFFDGHIDKFNPAAVEKAANKEE